MSAYNDPRLLEAQHRVKMMFGDRVSVFEAGRFISKFGQNDVVGTGGATVMTLPSGITEEVMLTDNLITHVSSSDAGDNQKITLTGFTISSSLLTRETQEVTLNGQNKVALEIPLARANRLTNDGTTDFAGDVYVYEDGTITGGVPDTSSTVHLMIPIGANQSQKAQATTAKDEYLFITKMYADCLEKATAYANVEFQIRHNGGVWRRQTNISAGSASSGRTLEADPLYIVPPNHDFRLFATAGAINTSISGGFLGYYAKVKS